MRAVKAILGISAMLLLALIVSGLYMAIQRALRPPEEEAALLPVEVITAEVQPFYERFTYTGNVLGGHSTMVSARVGSQVEKLLVDAGDTVQAGQVLAVLDDTVFAAQAAVAKASREIARLNLESAQSARPELIAQAEASHRVAQLAAETAYKNYQRTQSLFDEGVVSRAELEAAQLNYETAKSQYTAAAKNLEIARAGAREEDKQSLQMALQLAEAQLDLTQTNLGYTRVTAPFAGRIARRLADLGSFLGAGDPVFELVSLEGLTVEVFVPPDKIDLFRPGQVATVTLQGTAEPVQAEVRLVSPSADARTRLFRVELQLPPEAPALPYQFAQVDVSWERGAGTVVLPAKAILGIASAEPYVFIVEAATAKKVPVKLGLRNGTCAQILEPLRGGETVIVTGQSYVADGTPVAPQRAEEQCRPDSTTNP